MAQSLGILTPQQARASWPDRLTGFGLVLGALVWCLALLRFWGTSPEYSDRFLILLGAAWAAWTLRPTFQQAPVCPWPFVGGFILLSGTTLHTLAWWMPFRGSSTHSIQLWMMAVGLVLATSGWIVAREGWRRCRALAFPLIFPLFALQPPTTVMMHLQKHLQAATTSLAHLGLDGLGYRVQRTGFVLALPHGDLGVAEACSGIRSLTALTAMAAYVAHLRGYGPGRGIPFVFASIPIVIFVNAIRVVLSGVIQEAFGERFIQGTWHEALGLLMVLVGLGGILSLAALMDRSTATPIAVPPEQPTNGIIPFSSRHWASWVCSVIVSVAVILSLRGGTRQVGFVMAREVQADLHAIPWQIDEWQGVELPVEPHIRLTLEPDQIIHRRYVNNLGVAVEVWVIVWASPDLVKGYHHPDICLPGRGYQVRRRWTEPLTVWGETWPVTARMLENGSQPLLAFYYTQEGSRVWTEADERRAMLQLGGFASLREWAANSFQTEEPHREPRVVVLLGTRAVDATTEQSLRRFLHHWPIRIGEVCPWSIPGSTRP
jgi:exosortase